MDEVVDEFCIYVIAHVAFEALTDDIMANCLFSHIHVEMTIIVAAVTFDAVPSCFWAHIHVGREVSFAGLPDQLLLF